MIKKLAKYGNSRALVIDKPILELLSIDENTKLEIETDGISLIITPVCKGRNIEGVKDKKLREIIAKNIKKYGPLLDKLAKH